MYAMAGCSAVYALGVAGFGVRKIRYDFVRSGHRPRFSGSGDAHHINTITAKMVCIFFVQFL